MADPADTASPDDDDLGASIARAYDAQVDDTDSTETASPSSTAPAPTSTQAASAPLPTEAADAGRARGPDGKFVKGAAPAAAAAVSAHAPTGAAEFKVPEKWPAQVKAELQAIHAVNPQHAQWLVGQYEQMRAISAQHHNRSQEYLRAHEQFLAPGRQARALKGIDDGAYIRNLLAAGDFLDKSPIEGMKYLAKQYGVEHLVQFQENQGGGEPEIPPYVRELQQKTNAMAHFIAEQTRGHEAQQLQSASNWINAFADQKDPQGQPRYPYFDELLPEIIEVVQYQRNSGQEVDVNAAYERAKRLNDAVWLKSQRAGSAEAEKAAAAQRARDIEDAKRASVSVGGSGAATSNAVPDDLGAHLSSVYDKLTS